MGHMVLEIEGNNGSVDFKALAPNDAIDVSPGSGPDSAPQLEIITKWLYMVGSRPAATSDIALGGSDHTKLVVQMIDPTAGNHGRVRFILVDGQDAWVRRLDGSDSHTMSSAWSFIDAWRASDGSLDRIDDAATFDRDTTPGSEGLMDHIDEIRAEYGIE